MVVDSQINGDFARMILLKIGPDSIMKIFSTKQLSRCYERKVRSTTIYLLVVIALLFLRTGEVCADQVSWIGGATGYWGVPTNWNTGMVPGAGDEVMVDLGEPVTIFHDSGETIIGALSMIGKLDLQGGSFTVSGSATIDGGLTISNGAALIAYGTEANIVISGVVDIGNGNVLARDGGHISLPSVTRYQGGGRLRAEGTGSMLALTSLASIGIGEPEPIDSLYDAISREYSGYQSPSIPEEGSEKGIFAAYSREVSGYQSQPVSEEGSEKGIFATYSREVSGYHRQPVPIEGSEKGIFEIYSREISGYQRQSVPVEGSEKGIFEIYSREISGFHQPQGLGDDAESVVIEAISREISLEHLMSPE
jgi:hypothetical protein